MALTITPINLNEANALVAMYHRHHKPVTGAKFAVAVSDANGQVRGVAIVGRPVARGNDNDWTLEVNRCARMVSETLAACSTALPGELHVHWATEDLSHIFLAKKAVSAFGYLAGDLLARLVAAAGIAPVARALIPPPPSSSCCGRQLNTTTVLIGFGH